MIDLEDNVVRHFHLCNRYVGPLLWCGKVIVWPPVRSNGRSSVLPVMFSFFLSFFRPPFSELPRPIALKLCQLIGICVYFIMQVQKLGGGHSPPPKKKLGGQKHAKFRSILDHFRLWSRISPERLMISKIGQHYKLWQFLLRLTKKSCELWSTNGLEFHVSLEPLKCTFLADYISALRGPLSHPSGFFGGDYISAPRGCCALKFIHALEIAQALIAHTRSRTGVPPKKLIVEI